MYLDTTLEMDSMHVLDAYSVEMDRLFGLVRIRHHNTLRLVIQWWIDFKALPYPLTTSHQIR